MKVDNINYLRENFRNNYEELKKLEESLEMHQVDVNLAVNGKHTMNIKFEDGIKSIHSQYDPEYEAKLILEKYNGIENYDYILFFGVGMGYLVTEVLKSYPSKKSIFI